MVFPSETPPKIGTAKDTATPAMRQYLEAKRLHPDAIVFFRMGDFYEMFFEDAVVTARALDLTLTSRSKDANGGGIPMCGVPHHALDTYLARLVQKGYRVAICDQVEDPRKAKGLVRREVVRVVSPGTLTDANYLDAREPAFLVAVAVPSTFLNARGAPPPRARAAALEDSLSSRGPQALSDVRGPSRGPKPEARSPEPAAQALGVALLDLSTGEFSTTEYPSAAAFNDELAVIRPREIIAASDVDLPRLLPSVREREIPVTALEGWAFDPRTAERTLTDQLQTHGLAGFGLDGHPAAIAAAGALVQYLKDTQKADLAHIRGLRFRPSADGLLIDPTTLKHLEVIEGTDGTRAGSLLHELDATATAMGARLLRSWLIRPLLTLEPIRDRLDAVEELAFRTTERGRFRDTLKAVQDLERLLARTALGTAGPRDLVGLRISLDVVPRVKHLLSELAAPLNQSLVASLDPLTDVREAIESTLVDEPPAVARDGGFLRDGVDPPLDELRTISRSGKQFIAEMEARERERTGVASLKIRYNRVFGYYIEVSKANLHAVPPDYHRKQTIAGAERFTTPTLKGYEEKVVGADERIVEREVALFEALRARVAAESPRIQETARALASLDVLAALADVATLQNYIKPHVHDGDELSATDVRHPVVERHAREAFVPNDIHLDGTGQQLIVLTGPNMGGKSTYLRQTALLCLLAQAGSFVPAREAKLPLVDRIYARVGASDNIARGQSTFMVEMQETASILQTATSRSLVVLDEIGRGTATFDGLSIAWAVAEHLATNTRARPKALFATHYHELTDLADAVPGVVNYHVAAREWNDGIVFLRKILPGRSDRSYGIQVARLAGLPPDVIQRAREILDSLERDELSRGGRPSLSGAPVAPQAQLGLFQAAESTDGPLTRRLRELNIDQTTPLEALTLLATLKKEADG